MKLFWSELGISNFDPCTNDRHERGFQKAMGHLDRIVNLELVST